jgi:hypothetical protein
MLRVYSLVGFKRIWEEKVLKKRKNNNNLAALHNEAVMTIH